MTVVKEYVIVIFYMTDHKPTPKAVLWDLDGTIVDSVSEVHTLFNKVFPRLGLPELTREEVRMELHGEFKDLIRRLSKDYHDQETLLKHVFAEPRINELPAVYTGIKEAITYFSEHGYQQALVTSRTNVDVGTNQGASTVLKALQFDLHIKTVVAAEDITHHKPHPEPMLLALKKLGVEPQNAVMIGDQPVDAIAAHAAGAKSILLDHEDTKETRKQFAETEADAICTGADEIIATVNKLLNTLDSK